jgi:hypothetical protein
MGAWGWDLFASDDAVDIREDWREGVAAGEDPSRITDRIVAAYGDPSPLDGGTGAGFWLVLAAVQHDSGLLQERVRARALEALAGGGDAAAWGDRAPHRAAVLRRLERKLLRGMPGRRTDAHGQRPTRP